MRAEMRTVLLTGWPLADIKERGHRLCAYFNGRLVSEIAVYNRSRWCFFHYGYGRRGGVGDVNAALSFFKSCLRFNGWTGTVKGGNPLLEDGIEPDGFRDFDLPTTDNLNDLKDFIIRYLNGRFPDAKIADAAIYAGMGWVLATKGEDALGIRDIDVNVFFEPGGPRSVAWITHLKYNWNGQERTIDLYWNTLPSGMTPVEYIEAKSRKAKAGRWLTIPDRPWVSLLTGATIWNGRMESE